MHNLTYLLAFAAGLGLTVQVGMNSTLRSGLGNAGLAALVSFLVGTIGLVCFIMATRVSWPTKAMVANLPAWAWFGGLFGAFYVATAAIAGPRIGATLLLGLVLLGQLTAALVVDHFGWIGFPHHPISLTKITGAALLLVGVLLIAR